MGYYKIMENGRTVFIMYAPVSKEDKELMSVVREVRLNISDLLFQEPLYKDSVTRNSYDCWLAAFLIKKHLPRTSAALSLRTCISSDLQKHL